MCQLGSQINFIQHLPFNHHRSRGRGHKLFYEQIPGTHNSVNHIFKKKKYPYLQQHN